LLLVRHNQLDSVIGAIFGGIFVSYYARSKMHWKTKRPMNQALRSQQGQVLPALDTARMRGSL